MYDYLAKNSEGEEIQIDLEAQVVRIPSIGKEIDFDISPFKKDCLLNGFDTIDYLLNTQREIQNFELTR
jgi:3-isopropylmalate/(R)-2-methylmalate dehydratase small subunit